MPINSTAVALVTGGAKRIGRAIVLRLHADGYRVCVHYHLSRQETEDLVLCLNKIRPDSAIAYAESLCSSDANDMSSCDPTPLSERCANMIEFCYQHFGRCDVLVNNASAYYPTPLLAGPDENKEGDTEMNAADLFGSNALAPYFLIRAFARRAEQVLPEDSACDVAAPLSRNFSVVNMVDSMSAQPLLQFSMYTMAKCALEGLTRAAAAELAPVGIRVNGVGPGLSVLPRDMPPAVQDEYRRKVPLGQREATGEEIAEVVSFLVSDKARYMTGSLLNVDGGWSLTRA